MKDQNFSQEQEKLHSYWLVTILNVVSKKLKIPGERLNRKCKLNKIREIESLPNQNSCRVCLLNAFAY